MELIESTLNATVLSDRIVLDDETFDEILDWVENVDTTPGFTRGQSSAEEQTTINGYKVTVKIFANTNNVSIVDVENDSEGVSLKVNELLAMQ